MSGRIIHYGDDDYHRLRALRGVGYTVESCHSLSELRWSLHFGLRADLIIFSELPGAVPSRAISLARTRHAPLVLFQDWIPHYDESEFDLVIPVLTSLEEWLRDIDCLVQHTSNRAKHPSPPQAEPPTPGENNGGTQENIVLEFRRSVAEPNGNPALLVDVEPPGPGHSEPAIAPADTGFLHSLEGEARLELFLRLRLSTCRPGTVLFLEEQLPEEVSFIVSGQVKLSVNSSDGRRFITHIASRGEALGLASAFTSSPHEVTAETCYFCELASVSCSEFLSFLDKYPSAFRLAARELGRSYNQACARLRTMGVSFTVMKKMAGLLLEWSAAGRTTRRGTQIHLALTHTEIGQCIGTTRESVTRTLHDFQSRGIIDQKGSILTILDRAALETCAAVN